MKGRTTGTVERGSLVYQLSALHKVRRVLIPCGVKHGDISKTMKTITAHFLRSPELKGIKAQQVAVYAVLPGYGAVIPCVMVYRCSPENYAKQGAA
jgi:hypothetical protein